MKKIIFLAIKKIGFDKYLFKNNNIYDKDNLLHSLFSMLNKINFRPNHIVDVGANHGTWTRKALQYFPDAYYTLLEPQEKLKNSIKDLVKENSKVIFHAVGAGSKTGSFMFTIVDRDDSCSFIYSEEKAMAMGFTQVEIPVVALNEFLPKTGLPVPDLIKIDAEGLDLEVLAGADDYFGITEVFMVEAAVMNKNYENSALKIITFLDNHGYRLFDITDLNRTPNINALWLLELVFIKKGGIIDNKIISYN